MSGETEAVLMIAKKPDKAARVRSSSIQNNPDKERWQIPYEEYVIIVVAAKRFVKNAKIFILPDDLLDCVHDACLKIESRPAYKAKISRLPTDHRLSFMLKCVKNIIWYRYRVETIKTRYNELTRPLLQGSIFLT